MKTKGLVKLTLIPLFALGLGSCRDTSQDFYKYKPREKENLVMKATSDHMGNILRIEEIGNNFIAIIAVDDRPSNKKKIGDGRFDVIKLRDVPEGHLLEKYVNLDSLNKLYQEVKETGNDFPGYGVYSKKRKN